MTWNWQKKEWPCFCFDRGALDGLERVFLKASGVLEGTYRHLDETDKSELTVELMSEEACQTSAIEGEMLERDSVQSSIRNELGLQVIPGNSSPAESGVAAMMVDVYRRWHERLSDHMLFSWHAMLMKGRRDISDVGCYRSHADPMRVVSGNLADSRIHFEAPPSIMISEEMRQFLAWFNQSDNEQALIRAGLSHLYFVSIHPFEDGNGRIGRAISEVALARSLGRPSLIALSTTIERRRKHYYQALEMSNKHLEVTPWLEWFGQTVIDAQARSISMIEFLVAKARLFDRVDGKLNARQQKALTRMFREGVDGFKGGLSAGNYMKITKAPPSTATRDLQDLVEMGALKKTGTLRHTRYFLALD